MRKLRINEIKRAAREGLKEHENFRTVFGSLLVGGLIQVVAMVLIVLAFRSWFTLIAAAFLIYCVDGVFKYGVASVTLTAASGGRVEFSAAFSGFHNLGCSFSANFLQNLYLTLWALLPCIPILLSIFIPFPSFLYIPIFLAAYVLVVIKSYSYSMAYFLLCDRPYIFGGKEAIALSRKMTDGNKVTLFLLDLSFIGWFLLSILSFGILWIVYVNAYYNTARSYLFIQIQKEYDKRFIKVKG